jgi:hypothetical protein
MPAVWANFLLQVYNMQAKRRRQYTDIAARFKCPVPSLWGVYTVRRWRFPADAPSRAALFATFAGSFRPAGRSLDGAERELPREFCTLGLHFCDYPRK